jgi:RNA polymerase sigma factor (sigma-70 family)
VIFQLIRANHRVVATLVSAVDRREEPLTKIATPDKFVSLLEQNKKIVYKVAATYSRNPADREDLAQEIVVQLWRSFARYDEGYRFSTWMYRVALNVAISFYRRESRRSRAEVSAEDAVQEVASLASEPAEVDDDIRLLRQLIEQLDELGRAVMILYLDDNPYSMIAEILGISETNVGTKINRIKQRLRRDLSLAL